MKKTVCGLDVHKDSVFCCILCADGRKIQHKFGVLTEELETLRDLMESESVEECTMESTSIYWIPIWRVLEHSVHLHLVNPYFIKQLPGKKSDVKDAEWIATCTQNDLIASSFVPDDRYSLCGSMTGAFSTSTRPSPAIWSNLTNAFSVVISV